MNKRYYLIHFVHSFISPNLSIFLSPNNKNCGCTCMCLIKYSYTREEIGSFGRRSTKVQGRCAKILFFSENPCFLPIFGLNWAKKPLFWRILGKNVRFLKKNGRLKWKMEDCIRSILPEKVNSWTFCNIQIGWNCVILLDFL